MYLQFHLHSMKEEEEEEQGVKQLQMLRTVHTTATPSHGLYVPTIGCTDYELFLFHLDNKKCEIKIKIKLNEN